MRDESTRYIRETDHEKALEAARKECREWDARDREREQTKIRSREADAYQRGMADAWKDALALLRRLSLKDATEAAGKAMAAKARK